MAVKDLKQNEMMAHLMSSLEEGKDIGEYGRLVFVMVGRHFLEEDELVRFLKKNPDVSETAARALVKQVEARGYNPPKREKIMQWQAEQRFPICPTEDPDGCNVYRNLPFPPEVFEKINEYYEKKAEAGN